MGGIFITLAPSVFHISFTDKTTIDTKIVLMYVFVNVIK